MGETEGRSPETVGVEEACKRLGIGRSLGYRLAREGGFPVPVLRIGRVFRVPTRALDALLLADGVANHVSEPFAPSRPVEPRRVVGSRWERIEAALMRLGDDDGWVARGKLTETLSKQGLSALQIRMALQHHDGEVESRVVRTPANRRPRTEYRLVVPVEREEGS